MLTFCIGRETIEALASGEPVEIGQNACAIKASSYDDPYRRIAELEAALAQIAAFAEVATDANWRDIILHIKRAT